MKNVNRHTLLRQMPFLLLALTFAPLYLTFRSISFDDGDSYNFALALRQFNLKLYQPQPPGFPVYIALGRLALRLYGDPLSALTLISALSGVVTALAIYGLGASYPLAGVGAALLVGFSPMGWLTAEKALSDAPGVAITLLTIWALWCGRENTLPFILGGLLTGLGLGLRPQNSLPTLILLVSLLVRHVYRRRPFRVFVAVVVSTIIGLLVWLLPTLKAVGGLHAYWSYISAHAAHIRTADSILSHPLTASSVKGRIIAFTNTFLLHTAGLSLPIRWIFPDVLRLIALVLFAIPGLIAAGWQRPLTRFLGVWSTVMAWQIFLFEAVDRPRLFLPLLPPIALLVTLGWSQLQSALRPYRLHWIPPLILTAVSFALLRFTLPLAVQLSTIPAPPTQATSYIAATYPPQETILLTAGSFRAAQTELPQYPLFYLYHFDALSMQDTLQQPGIRYVVIFDRDEIPEHIMQMLSDRWVFLEERNFSRNPLVHPQHANIRVQVFTFAHLMPPEQLVVLLGDCLDLGKKEDGKFLGEGWYYHGFYHEDIGGVSGRWAGQVLTATLRFVIPHQSTFQLSLRAVAYPDNQELTLYLNGKQVGHLSLYNAWEVYTLTIPSNVFLAGEIGQLDLVHKYLAVPFERTGGISSDYRPLAAAYDWFCLKQFQPQRRSSSHENYDAFDLSQTDKLKRTRRTHPKSE